MTSIEQAVNSPARQGLLLVAVLIVACTTATVSEPEPSPSRLETLVPGSAMHGVHGLAFDADDNLYGASLTGYSVYQIDTQSGEVTVAVEPPLGNSDDVAVAADGTLVWTAGAFSAVLAKSPDGEVKMLAGDLPGINSINYAPDGRLYATRVFAGDALYEIDTEGVKPAREIASKLGGLNGFEITADNQLYGPLFFKSKVVRVDLATGQLSDVADGFTVPAAVNIDSRNNLFVVDIRSGEVTRINLDSGDRRIIALLQPPLDNLAIDSNDLVYVSNPAFNRITEINPDTGATRTVVEGQLSSPGGIVLTEHEERASVAIADFWGNRFADSETGAITMLPSPQGVTASSNLAMSPDFTALVSIWPFGNVYLVDRATNKLVKSVKLKAPYGVQFLPDNSFVIADFNSGTLVHAAAGKDRSKKVITDQLSGPVGVAYAGENMAYVTEYLSGVVSRVNLATGATIGVAWDLQQPEGIAIAPDGRLIVAEVGAQRLIAIDPDTGEVETVADGLPIGLAGGDDLPPPFLLTGVAVEANGSIIFSSDIDNAIYRVHPQ
jgi:sugar lactone lactonase YvrE